MALHLKVNDRGSLPHKGAPEWDFHLPAQVTPARAVPEQVLMAVRLSAHAKKLQMSVKRKPMCVCGCAANCRRLYS